MKTRKDNVQKITVLDTTLRDGAQSPGAALSLEDSIEIALMLEKAGVDVIEAGFAASSKHDRKVIREVGARTARPIICSLSRCIQPDIDYVIESMQNFLNRSRIHLFIATSPIHLEKKLGKTFEEVVEIMQKCVRYAKQYIAEVEVTAEDGGRTDNDTLVAFYDAAIEAGATTLNFADTVGECLPFEIEQKVSHIVKHCIESKKENVELYEKLSVSVHCHDDKGCATANTISGVRAGANQVECVINGNGERAGNAALEEVVMNIHARPELGDVSHIITQSFVELSQKVQQASGFMMPPNKAIVGSNAFAHGAGIHQDGMFKNAGTYEIFNPQDVGWENSQFPLTRHSGRHAFAQKVFKLTGKEINGEYLNTLFVLFMKQSMYHKIVPDHVVRKLLNVNSV